MSSDGERQEYNGYSGPEEVETVSDALDFLGLEPPIDDDGVDSRFQDIALDIHPDANGTTELFQAGNKARDILKGDRDVEGGQTSTGETTDSSRDSERGKGTRAGEQRSGSTTGFGFGSESQEEDFSDLVDAVEERVVRVAKENPEMGGFVDEFGSREVANILTSLILNGSIELGDVEKFLSGERESRGSRGRDSRFSRKGRSGDDRFGGGDDRFG